MDTDTPETETLRILVANALSVAHTALLVAHTSSHFLATPIGPVGPGASLTEEVAFTPTATGSGRVLMLILASGTTAAADTVLMSASVDTVIPVGSGSNGVPSSAVNGGAHAFSGSQFWIKQVTPGTSHNFGFQVTTAAAAGSNITIPSAGALILLIEMP